MRKLVRHGSASSDDTPPPKRVCPEPQPARPDISLSECRAYALLRCGHIVGRLCRRPGQTDVTAAAQDRSERIWLLSRYIALLHLVAGTSTGPAPGRQPFSGPRVERVIEICRKTQRLTGYEQEFLDENADLVTQLRFRMLGPATNFLELYYEDLANDSESAERYEEIFEWVNATIHEPVEKIAQTSTAYFAGTGGSWDAVVGALECDTFAFDDHP